MASTYVNDLRLNEMATGDASGSWGTVTNTNLELIGEAFSYGTETIGDADSTLTIADGAADAARSFYLKITSSVDLTTTRIVTLGPNTVSKVWMIENATTGSQVITIKQGSGATINVPNGQVKMLATDGAGSGGAVLDLLVDVDLTGTTTLVNLDVSGAVDIAGDLTLSAGGDGALRFTAASSVKVLDNNAAALVFEEADNAYMTFVTTDGSEAVKFDKALDINAATQIDATVTVGVDDTGYDVKFFGATAGAYMLWDESADDLILGGAAGLSVNSTALVTGVLTTTAATVSNGGGQFNGAINVGVDDTGYDVKFFGATTGKSLLWDESADSLTVAGNLSVDGGTIKLDGNYPVGTDNVALGDAALDSVEAGGSYNVAIGASAGTAITTGDTNTAIGDVALTANTTASNNVAVGSVAMNVNTTGGNNVAVGTEALRQNTTASNNTAVGYQAGYTNTISQYNTAIGNQVLYTANRTADANGFNTAVGHQAGYSATTGQFNTYIGQSSGYYITTGSKNTIIGGYTGNNGGLDIRTSSNNIVLSDGDGNPRVIVDSSGNVVVGKTVLDNSTVGIRMNAAGDASFVADGARPLVLNRKTSDGDIALFLKDNTTVGSIGSTNFNGSKPYITNPQSSGAGLGFYTNAIFPTNASGAPSDGVVDLGIATYYKFKNLHLSGGVVFGDAGGSGTPTANTLDSYEEGSWTPVWSPATGAFSSVTYRFQNAVYTKIGNVVYISCQLSSDAITVDTGSGNISIGGLPFTAVAVQNSSMAVSSANDFAGDFPNAANVGPSSQTLRLYYRTAVNGATSLLNVTDLSTATSYGNAIDLSGFYYTAA
jgi:hypothetical protein